MLKLNHTSSANSAVFSRRRILQICGVAGVLGAVYYYGFVPRSQLKVVRHTQLLMGTIVNITVCAEEHLRPGQPDFPIKP